MKIVDSNSLGALAHAVSNAGRVGGAAGVAGPGKGLAGAALAPTDTAEISSLGGKLADAASAVSPERAAKVEALRSVVGAGAYAVDGAAVARGIVADGLTAGPGGAGPEESDT